MPLAVVHGPLFRGGLGIIQLEEQQIIKHFSVFQGHLRRNDNVATSLCIQLMNQQLEVGCGSLFLNTDPSQYPYATKTTRMSYLWKQCFRFNIKVCLHHQWEPSGTDGTTDTIMDHMIILYKNSKYKERILKRINACQLYLKVLWVADLLVSPSSTLMNTALINGTTCNTHTSLHYPYQAKPSRADFSLWKDSIHRCFCKYVTPAGNTRAEVHIVRSTIIPEPFSIKSSLSDYHEIVQSLRYNSTLINKFNNLPRRFKDIIGDIEIPADECASLITALKCGMAASASDGSYLEDVNRGSHAYKIIITTNDEGGVQGASISPASDKMSSSPTEHYGAIAILVVLIVILYHHNEDGYGWPTLMLYIDNQEVVDRGSTRRPNFLNIGQYLTHDFDLWMVMSQLQDHLALKVEFEWIKGHQCLSMDIDNSTGVLLNIDVDQLATKQYSKNIITPQCGVFHAGTVCYHQEGNHVQDIHNAITSRETDCDILNYYRSKGWKCENLKRVDWVTLGKFLKRRHPIERCKIIQLMHDWQHTGYQKQQFQYESNSSHTRDAHTDCPLHCGHLEMPLHYMHCTSDIIMTAHTKGLEKLEKSLYKFHTSPPLLEAILNGLLCWETYTEYDLDGESHPTLFDIPHTRLLETQKEIGWDKFLKGFIVKDWGILQGQYYQQQSNLNRRKYTKKTWSHNLLLQLHYYRQQVWKVRNDTLHGGVTKEQRQLNRTQMIMEVKALYKKNRRRIPLCERILFQLPLRFRIKQGNQQLQLWIKRAKLMFATYEDIPIKNDQCTRITDWLSNWDIRDSVAADSIHESLVPDQRMRVESFDSDTSAPRLGKEQTNIANWLKSWGHNPTLDNTKETREVNVATQVPTETEYSDLR
jgi:hypothetical protein